VKPHGARVTIKLLLADTPAQPLLAAMASA
jgi:hypothetical protein